MFDIDNVTDRLLGRRAISAADLFESIISALQVMSFVPCLPIEIGPGVRNYHKDGSRYSGAHIRAMNARNGVGSRRKRQARMQSEAL